MQCAFAPGYSISTRMAFTYILGNRRYVFADLRELLAKATPLRSGDELAGLAASSAEERVAAQFALADLPLAHFLTEHVVAYEDDEVTRLIVESHDAEAFAPIRSLTVGELRDWLLSDDATGERLAELAPGLTPEMAAAVSKLMRLQDLILAAAKMRVVTRFRTTVGLAGRLSARLQPNHPTDDMAGIVAGMLDGLLLGSGDAVVGINPAGDSVATTMQLLRLIDAMRQRFQIPMQSGVGACHHANESDGTRCAHGPDLSIHRRYRECQSKFWNQPGSIGRGTSGRAVAEARSGLCRRRRRR